MIGVLKTTAPVMEANIHEAKSHEVISDGGVNHALGALGCDTEIFIVRLRARPTSGLHRYDAQQRRMFTVVCGQTNSQVPTEVRRVLEEALAVAR